MVKQKKYKTREFTKEFLRMNAMEGDPDVVECELVEKSRWSIQYEVIFKHEDKFYATAYSVGATEMQDHPAYEYDDLTCVEVEPREETIVVTKYVSVPLES